MTPVCVGSQECESGDNETRYRPIGATALRLRDSHRRLSHSALLTVRNGLIGRRNACCDPPPRIPLVSTYILKLPITLKPDPFVHERWYSVWLAGHLLMSGQISASARQDMHQTAGRGSYTAMKQVSMQRRHTGGSASSVVARSLSCHDSGTATEWARARHD